MLAGIHFQWINDKGETLEKILSMKKTFIGFIVPALLDKSLTNKGKDIFGRVYPEENYYPSWFVDALKQEVKNKNVIWAQEGFMHYCEPCFELFEQNGGRENHGYPDPFHEHVCLNGNSQTLEEQKSAIKNTTDGIYANCNYIVFCARWNVFSNYSISKNKRFRTDWERRGRFSDWPEMGSS